MKSTHASDFSDTAVVEVSTAAERDELMKLARFLEQVLQQGAEHGAELVFDKGTARVPTSALRAFRLIVGMLLNQGTVGVVGVDETLTTQEAADLLNVSRQYVVRLIKEDRLPHHMVGTHHRVYLRDTLAFKRERDAKRQAALKKIIRLGEESEAAHAERQQTK